MGFRAEPVGTRREPWIARFMGVPGADVQLVHLYGWACISSIIEFVTPQGEAIRPAANHPAQRICASVSPISRRSGPTILARGGTLQGDTTEITEGIAKGLRGLYMRDPNGIMIELVETKT